MQAQDIMTVIPITCSLDNRIAEVAGLFLKHDLEVLPVVNHDGVLLGFIDRAKLYETIYKEMNYGTQVKDIMISNVKSIAPETELAGLYPLSYSTVPVTRDGKFLGIITDEVVENYRNLNLNSIPIQVQALLEATNNGIIAIDREQSIVFFNKAAEVMLGLKRSAVLNRLYKEVFKGNLHSVLKNWQIVSNHKLVHEDKTLLSMNNPIVVGGQVIGALAVLQDISSMEKVLSELEYTKQLKAETDAIIEASFDSIFVTDAKGNVLNLNEAYTRITGINAAEVIGKNMYDLVEQGFYDRSATVMVIENHTPVTFLQHIKNNKTMLVTGNPIFNAQGELIKVLTNGRDVTELMRLKQEVEQAYNLSRHYEKELKRVTMQSGEMVISSDKTKELLDLTRRIAKVDSTVLIYGESGVGKELVARELHANSLRKDKPLVNINCAAIPESLLESELFGYESGAFSGAKKGGKMGLFEIANGGTLFLDEIGEMPLNLQSKVLRVIQEKEILRIGGTTPISVDVRLIAATNRDLWEMARKGQFRQDLYYRLNVVPLLVPALRDRKEDIPALAIHFLRIFNDQYVMNKTLDERVMNKLWDYEWPGNIRELRNVIERAVVTSIDTVIRQVNLGENTDEHIGELKIDWDDTPNIDLKEKVNAFEKDILLHYVNTYKSSRKVAKALGVSQTSVVRKAAQHGIILDGS